MKRNLILTALLVTSLLPVGSVKAAPDLGDVIKGIVIGGTTGAALAAVATPFCAMTYAAARFITDPYLYVNGKRRYDGKEAGQSVDKSDVCLYCKKGTGLQEQCSACYHARDYEAWEANGHPLKRQGKEMRGYALQYRTNQFHDLIRTWHKPLIVAGGVTGAVVSYAKLASK